MDGWTVKLVAAAALTLSGAAGGRALGSARKMRLEQIARLRAALGRLEVGMLEKMLPLREALSGCGHPALLEMAGAMRGARPAAAWLLVREKAIARGGTLCCLGEEELGVLGRLFDGLGVSGASEQRLLLREASVHLERLEGRARIKAEEQARLYGTLGLLAGLALAVCLL